MLILKGFIIGVGKIIPGISGSILAISMGLYDKTIRAISHFFKDVKNNFIFLIQIFIGIFLAIIFGSRLIYYLITNHYLITIYTIIGFILGEIPVLIKKCHYTKKNFIYTLIPFLLIITLNYFTNSQIKTTANNITVVALGLIEAATTIIPGISGTAVLINMGYYNFVLANVSSMSITFWLFYVIGIIIGFFLFIKIIDYLMTRHSEKFYLIINGFVLSSLLTIFIKTFANFSVTSFIVGIIMMIVASILSYLNS